MNQMQNISEGGEKVFGLFFGSVCLAVAFLGSFSVWTIVFLCSFSCLLFFLALKYPHSLKVPNIFWIQFGLLLGRIIAPIVMGLIYVGVFSLINLVVKLSRITILHNKRDTSATTYWNVRRDKPENMKSQF